MNESLKEKKIAFIGCGAMGGAIVHSLLENLNLNAQDIQISDPNSQHRNFLSSKYGIKSTCDNLSVIVDADIILLAIKPQILSAVTSELRGCIPQNALIISIMAGIPIAAIQNGLLHNAVVRTMSNTPAQIGEAMTVWTASKEVNDEQRASAAAILQGMGLELYVLHEDALDMATAICGTGPTYAFLLIEALIDAAVHMGLPRADARTLVIQTVLGSAKLAMQSDKHPAELRNMVTSPGGTTAEAVYQMEKGGMRTVLSKAVWAAYQKSKLLGKKAAETLEVSNDLDSNKPKTSNRHS